MAETKIALIPSVVITGLTQRRYGLVLTDVRALFVLQRSLSLPLMWASLGGGGAAGILLATLANAGFSITLYAFVFGAFLGMGAAWAGMRERIPSYATLNPDQLAGRKGAVVIPYASIQGVAIEMNPRGSSRLRMKYFHPDGRRLEVRVLLLPEIRWLQSRVEAGLKPREAFAEYAESVRQALVRALPPDAASKVGLA